MQSTLLQLFKDNPSLAVGISILASILVAVLGLLPSVFITAANLLFFGFWNGAFISFLGEAIGAAIAFILYRYGFKNKMAKSLDKFPKLKTLTGADNKEAFYLVFSLRLIPFVPSGLITFGAAIGKISLLLFFIASSLGKLPAIFLEAWSVYEVTQFGWVGKAILVVVAIGLLYWLLRKKK